jgi:uncharacterized protein YceK
VWYYSIYCICMSGKATTAMVRTTSRGTSTSFYNYAMLYSSRLVSLLDYKHTHLMTLVFSIVTDAALLPHSITCISSLSSSHRWLDGAVASPDSGSITIFKEGVKILTHLNQFLKDVGWVRAETVGLSSMLMGWLMLWEE